MFLDLLQWFEHSPVFVLLRSSNWFFPVVAAFHLFGLALLGGATLLLDLRLLGFGLWREPAGALASDARRWMLAGLALLVPTGLLMFLSTATKCYFLPAFWVKMTVLALALVLTFTARRRAVEAASSQETTMGGRAVAAISLSLWITVAVCGRLIGFY